MIKSKPTSLFYRRPLCLALTLGMATWAICPLLPSSYKIPIATVLFSVAIFSFCLYAIKRKKLPFLKVVTLASALIGTALLVFFFTVDSVRDTYTFSEAKRYTLTLRLEEIMDSDSDTPSYRATVTEINGEATDLAALYTHYAPNEFRQNDTLYIKARLSPSDSDYRASELLSSGIGVVIKNAYLQNSDMTEEDAPHLAEDQGFFLTNTVRDTLLSVEDDRTGALLTALFLGDTSELSAQDKLAFRRIGISHLTAVSGLHISLLICALEKLLRLLHTPKSLRIGISLALLVIYLALVGFTPSALRAGIMHLIVIFAFIRQGQADSLTALALAAYLICLFSPATVYAAGFWLSVCATAGILILLDVRSHQRQKEKKRPFYVKFPLFLYRYVKDMLLISIGASAFVLPLSFAMFGAFSPIAPLTSLVLAPLFQLLLYAACLAPLFALCPFLFAPVKMLAHFALNATRALASSRFVYVDVNGVLDLLLSLLPVFLLLFFAILLPRMKKIAVLSLVFSFLFVSAAFLVPHALQISGGAVAFLSYGHSESLAFRKDGEITVCEMQSTYTYRQYNVDELLSDMGESVIDTYVLAAYLEDSESNLQTLVSRCLVERILLPIPKTAIEQIRYDKLIAILDKEEIEHATYEPQAVTELSDDLTLRHYEAGKYPLTELCFDGDTILYTAADNLSGMGGDPNLLYALTRADLLIIGESKSDQTISLPYVRERLKTVLIGGTSRPIRLPMEGVSVIHTDVVTVLNVTK